MTRTAVGWIEKIKELMRFKVETRTKGFNVISELTKVCLSNGKEGLSERLNELHRECEKLNSQLGAIEDGLRSAETNYQRTLCKESLYEISDDLIAARRIAPDTNDLAQKKEAFNRADEAFRKAVIEDRFLECNVKLLGELKHCTEVLLSSSKQQREEQEHFDKRWSEISGDYQEAIKLPPHNKKASEALQLMQQSFVIVADRFQKKQFGEIDELLNTLMQRITTVKEELIAYTQLKDRVYKRTKELESIFQEARKLQVSEEHQTKLQNSVFDQCFLIDRYHDSEPEKAWRALEEAEKVSRLLLDEKREGCAEFTLAYKRLYPSLVTAKKMDGAKGDIDILLKEVLKIDQEINELKNNDSYIEATKLLQQLEENVSKVVNHESCKLFEEAKELSKPVLLSWEQAAVCKSIDYKNMQTLVKEMTQYYRAWKKYYDLFEGTSVRVLCKPFGEAIDKVFQLKKEYDEVVKNVLTEKNKVLGDYETALLVPQELAPQEYGQMVKEAKTFNELLQESDFSGAENQLGILKNAINVLQKNGDVRIILLYHKAWKQEAEGPYKKAIVIQPFNDDIREWLDELKKAKEESDELFKEDDFRSAGLKLQTVRDVANKILKAAETHELTAGPEVVNAQNEVEELSKKGVLMLCSNDKKVDLLKKLRGGSNEMSQESRKAQCLIYQSLNLDDEFLKEDQKRQKQTVDEILKSEKLCQDLKNAKESWHSMKVPEKTELMKRVLKVQSEKLYGGEPPEFHEINEGFEGTKIRGGAFNTESGKIKINVNPRAPFNRDFESTLNTLLHENTHNYQYKLAKQYEKGELQNDPRLQQAILFSTNFAPQGYVKGKEDYSTYLKQPTEEHAHINSPNMAREILLGISKN